MLKKSLIIISIFCLITFMSSFVFAANMVEGTGNVLRNAGNGIEHLVTDATDAAKNGMNTMTNMMDNMGNDEANNNDNMEDDMTRNDNNDGGMTATDDGGYTATRTSTSRATPTTDSSFVWIILATAGIIIAALVWYYGTQTTDKNSH